MKDFADLVNAFTAAAGPIIIIYILLLYRKQLNALFTGASEISFEFLGNKFQVKPSTPPKGDDATPLPALAHDEKLPLDYLFLNHTSFLRTDKQEEFQKRTQVDLPHYDIRVVVDSYYQRALDRVSRVEYYLDDAFPDPVQTRYNRKDKYLLKELANGQFVLQAKVYLVDKSAPILLQRYITLWKEGPRV